MIAKNWFDEVAIIRNKLENGSFQYSFSHDFMPAALEPYFGLMNAFTRPGNIDSCGIRISKEWVAIAFGYDARIRYMPRYQTCARTDGDFRVHTNTAEGFFGLFKRAVVGVWHQVSAKHLHRYASEHEFRWNVRERGVAERIGRCLLGRAGRLRLRELFA